MIETVSFCGVEFAIIVRSDFHKPGVHFFTPADSSQQLGYMRHPAGHIIEAHIHSRLARAINFTSEVLFLRRGRLRVDFYSDAGDYLESRELGVGDVILLAAGGHGFEVLEEIEMIEVKQGPYRGNKDKRRITNITAAEARITRAGTSPTKLNDTDL
jgi:mannose-6-phosphate isomerase-like protein (cupin superfamily)